MKSNIYFLIFIIILFIYFCFFQVDNCVYDIQCTSALEHSICSAEKVCKCVLPYQEYLGFCVENLPDLQEIPSLTNLKNLENENEKIEISYSHIFVYVTILFCCVIELIAIFYIYRKIKKLILSNSRPRNSLQMFTL